MFEWIIVYTHIYIYFTFEKYIYIKKNPQQFSVSACDQPPGFSVYGSSSPNGLFQTINGLKRWMGYFKRLH